MRPIKTKQDFYRLTNQGLCGNTPRTWNSAEEFFQDFDGTADEKVGIRSLNISSPTCKSAVLVSELLSETVVLHPGSFVITRIPARQDEDFLCLQGEIGFVYEELQLHYTNKWGYMRKQLAEHGKYAKTLEALSLVKSYCDRKSQDMIWDLFSRFHLPKEDLTIEFTVFPEEIPRIGVFPDLNTLIWEVRHY